MDELPTGGRKGRVALIIGGARSGKSRHAQTLAEAGENRLIFIATAQAFDAEMENRIADHRAERGARWRTVEAPIALADAIRNSDGPDTTILVDCLTLWASNLLLNDEDIDRHRLALEEAMAIVRGDLIFVTNEVGMGIVPDNALARRFRDVAGRINQSVAQSADTVDLVMAGLRMRMKEGGQDRTV